MPSKKEGSIYKLDDGGETTTTAEAGTSELFIYVTNFIYTSVADDERRKRCYDVLSRADRKRRGERDASYFSRCK